MNSQQKHLIVVAGPTASGKTDIAIELAKWLQTEVVSADSRQLFKDMHIGTARPLTDELQNIPHHLLGSHAIEDKMSAGLYEEEALHIIHDLFNKKNHIIVAGGTGLYIKAICEGFDDMPEISDDTRVHLNTLYKEKGLQHLQQLLEQKDPDYYKEADIHNPQRVIRALEVIETTGKPYTAFRKRAKKVRPFNIIKIGLNTDREELYSRINQRVDKMVDSGLIEEARRLHPKKSLNALQTVGYKELFDFFDGLLSQGEAIALIKQNTRRYAKRQLTWFRRDETFEWFHPLDISGIKQYISSIIGH